MTVELIYKPVILETENPAQTLSPWPVITLTCDYTSRTWWIFPWRHVSLAGQQCHQAVSVCSCTILLRPQLSRGTHQLTVTWCRTTCTWLLVFSWLELLCLLAWGTSWCSVHTPGKTVFASFYHSEAGLPHAVNGPVLPYHSFRFSSCHLDPSHFHFSANMMLHHFSLQS